MGERSYHYTESDPTINFEIFPGCSYLFHYNKETYWDRYQRLLYIDLDN